MGLYDWIISRLKTPRIPREIFFEDSDPVFTNESNNENKSNMETNSEIKGEFKELHGLEMLEEFLNIDFEPDGYNDALLDPNNSYAEAGKQRLLSLLELKVGIAIRYHDEKIKDFESAIKRLNNNNIDDEADDKGNELLKHQEKKKKLETILSESKMNKGVGYIIVLSYERGFKRGISSWLNGQLGD